MGRKNAQHDRQSKRNASKSKNISQQRKEINLECEKLLQLCSNPFQATNLWEDYLEVSNILEKIKSLEQLNELSSVERFDAVEEFVQWLKQNGAEFDGVKIHNYSDYGLGVQAEKNFKENDLILKIPEKVIFNSFTAAPELKDIENDALIQLMPQVALSIALLIEKNKDDSKWKPYLDILPKKYHTVLYMNVDDLKILKGSSVLDSTLKHCKNIVRQYSYFYKLFHQTENSVSSLLRDTFNYDEYRWAVSTVMTRQNIIPFKKNLQMIHSLIPMWDMCNHLEGKITTDFDDLSNSCVCYAMKDFDAGSQIFIYYGSRTNSEFFLHAGFVYPDNKNDSFKLQLGISKSDPLEKKRVMLLSKINLSAVNEYFVKPEPLSGSLLGFLRVFNMDESQLDQWLSSETTINITNSSYVMEKDLDNKVLKYIITRLKLLLTSYQISEEELKSDDLTLQPCKRLALEMKLSEKRMLQKILKAYEKCT